MKRKGRAAGWKNRASAWRVIVEGPSIGPERFRDRGPLRVEIPQAAERSINPRAALTRAAGHLYASSCRILKGGINAPVLSHSFQRVLCSFSSSARPRVISAPTAVISLSPSLSPLVLFTRGTLLPLVFRRRIWTKRALKNEDIFVQGYLVFFFWEIVSFEDF